MKLGLPWPKKTLIVKGVMGSELIVPIKIFTQNGLNVQINDIYTVGRDEKCSFNRRVKVFYEPHATRYDFKKCDICRKYKRKFNKVPKDKIMIEVHSYD